MLSMMGEARRRLPLIAISVAALTQLGGTSIDIYTRSANLAVQDFAFAHPLQDPSDIFDTLAVDPLVRAITAEARASELRQRPPVKSAVVEIDGLSPLIGRRVASAISILDGETASPRKLKPFRYSSLLSRKGPTRRGRTVAPSHLVASSIAHAAAKTGVDHGYLYRAALRESSFDPNARARTSSALGLFQFLDDTWLLVIKRHGARHGFGHFASRISVDRAGRPHVEDAGLRYEILAARRDPYLSAVMGAEFTRDNQSVLRGSLGRAPTHGETYIAHFLGAEGGARLLKAAKSTPSAPAAGLFPRAAGANRTIFFDKYGRPRSAYEVATILRQKAEP